MNNPKGIFSKAFALFAFAATAVFALSAAADDIYWIGGTDNKTWNDENNWDLARKPKWGDTVHITNSVTLSFTADPGTDAIRVSGGDVTINTGNYRFYTGNAQSSAFDVFVESGRTLTWKGTYLISGNTAKTFVKSGGGTLTISVGIGNSGSKFKSVEVREGILNHTTQYNEMITSSSVLKIGSSGTYKINHATTQTISSGMVVDIAEGGVLDLCNNSNSRTLRGLTGGGRIVNNAKGLTIKGEGIAAKSDGLFSGTLSGTVNVVPENGNAFIVGGSQTLADCTLNVTWPASFKTPLKFAAGIGTFTVNDIPDIDVHVDVEGKPIKFIFPGNSWYVDPSLDASGDGTAADRAFKTFAEAFAVTASGDTVWAAPGTYNTEVFTAKSTSGQTEVAADFRLAIPAGVKVRSLGSAADTIIDGGGVVKGVYLNNNSHLAGFTIQNGYGTTAGGGLYALDTVTEAYVIDCDIKNNKTKSGVACGEAYGKNLRFYRCRFLGNDLANTAQGSSNLGTLWSCFINGYNKVNYDYFYYAGSVGRFRNCTFGDALYGGGLKTNQATIELYNGIFLKNELGAIGGSSKSIYYYDCLLASSKTKDGVVCDADCVFSVTKAEVVDSSYKPLADSLAVDGGNNSYYYGKIPQALLNTYGDTDLAGVPRRLNGAIDNGAYEYDWRPTFCKILTKNRGMTIDSITGGVTTNETGLTFANGDKLAVSLGRDRKYPATYSFSAQVTGDGCLRVYEGGTNLIHEITSSSLNNQFSLEQSNRLSLTFVFRGEGKAEISNFETHSVGLKVSFQ